MARETSRPDELQRKLEKKKTEQWKYDNDGNPERVVNEFSDVQAISLKRNENTETIKRNYNFPHI